MSNTNKLIHYAQTLTYDDLPSQAVKDVKTHILDTIGAILAGSMAEVSRNLVSLVKEWGGTPEGTIFSYGHKVPLHDAAWVNSVMSRGFDFETLLSGGATHVSASIIPAAFAICEYYQHIRNKPIRGQNLITAIALGNDLNWRFRVAGRQSTVMSGGWLAETFAPPAIAALGGNLLGFAPDKIAHAVGIAYGQCCGNYGSTVGEGGGFMAQLSQGLGTKAGVLSVLLADKGFTAFKDMIDGPWGIYAMYGNGDYDSDILVGDLGTHFESLTPGIKRYPSCGATQFPVYGALELATQYQIKAEDVTKVHLRVGESSYRLCGENKYNPFNSADALWNYRYSIAVALIKGKVFVDDFTEEAIQDPNILDFITKIDVDPDLGLKRGIEIEITLQNGRTYKNSINEMEPLTDAEIIEKFKNCNRFSVKPLPDEDVETFIQMISHLEEIDDVAEIVKILD